MKKLLLLLLLSLFSFNSHAYSVDVIFTVIEQEVIVFKCDDLIVDLSFPVADEINPEDEYPTILEFKYIEKDLAPDNPLCIEAKNNQNSKTNAPNLVRNGYGEMVERYNYKNPKYGSFVTVTQVLNDGITETSYLDKDLYIKHGKDIYWWRVGQKGVEKNYDNNVLDGPYISWYSNGQMFGYGFYVNGERVGISASWYANGQMQSISHEYLMPHSRSISWYENGQMEKELTFKNGRFDGTYTTWNEDGQVNSYTIYDEGVCIGGDCL